MLTRLLGLIIKRRHFWRYATFSEVAELYMARLLRQSANALFATFAAIYLYRSGFSLVDIMLFYAIYSIYRLVIVVPVAKVVAYAGPKHGMFWANMVMIPALLVFSTLPTLGLWAVGGYFILQGLSLVVYELSHKVNFSKIKNATHAGREIGVMNVMDKIAAGASPLIGGLIAWYGSPQLTLWIAAFLLLCSAVPLFFSKEQITTKQKISFKGFPFRLVWHSLRAQLGIGVDVSATGVLWPLLLVVVVFTGVVSEHDAVYAQVGSLASITLVVGFVISRVYGRLIDKNKGGDLLHYATAANAGVHLLRLTVATPAGAVVLNILNEIATIGQSMAFMRGMFDLADRSGYRISYFALIEIATYLGSLFLYLVAALAIALTGEQIGLGIAFVVAAGAILLVRTAHFPLYRR